MRNRFRLLTMLLLAACSDVTPTASIGRVRATPPSRVISDGAHTGLDGFYFHPPMVASPAVTGSFDADIVALAPAVVICESSVANADCGTTVPALAAFDAATSPAIIVDVAAEEYHVNWNTRGPAFDADHTYRVHVRAGAPGSRRELGYADILLTDTPGEARNLTSGDVIILKDGQTLPIKFRTETGIAGLLQLNISPDVVRAGGTVTGLATLRDLHGQPLPGAIVSWSSSGVPVSVESASPGTDAGGQSQATIMTGTTAGTATVTVTTAGLSASAELAVTPAVVNETEVLASMNVPRNSMAVAAHGGLLYAIAGWTNYVGLRNTVEVYDPATNQWSYRGPMPAPRMASAAAVHDGTIYVMGGTPGGSCCATVNAVSAYDPATDTWTTRAAMLESREQFGAAAIDGIIYVAGGWRPGPGHLATVEAYDPTTDTWTPKASMPAARAGHGVAAVNGKLYVVGGGDGSGLKATVFEYDPAADTWTAKASLPVPRSRLGAASVGNVLYAIGGVTAGGTGGEGVVRAYDVTTDTWTTKAGLSIPRYSHGVVALDGMVYAIGGTREILDVPQLEVYRP